MFIYLIFNQQESRTYKDKIIIIIKTVIIKIKITLQIILICSTKENH